MKLFEDKIRINTNPAGYFYDNYEFLDQSNRDIENRVRILLNDWFDKYPLEYQEKLLNRFIQNEFTSAFFELYIHELFNKLNFNISPIYDPKKRSPDFIIKNDNDLFIEARISEDNIYIPKGKYRILSEILDYINKNVVNPNYFIHITIKKISKSNPILSIYKMKITEWLDYLSKTENCSKESKNELEINNNGWIFLVRASKRKFIKTTNYQIIGSVFQGFWKENSKVKLKKAIAKKANHYPKPNSPFLLAINMLTLDLDQEDILDALFGDLQIGIPKDGREQVIESRTNNGAWFYKGKYINKRISALLIVKHLNPWRIARSEILIIHHPSPQYPIEKTLLPFNQMIFKNSNIQHCKGIHPNEIFKLPSGWPE